MLRPVAGADQDLPDAGAVRFPHRMGRTIRGAIPALLHHVTTRGNDRRSIFLDSADYEGFLAQLHKVGQHHHWSTQAYCLMPNHIHLLVQAPVDALSAGMHGLTGPYARRFHGRHGTSGHPFGGRFHAVPVIDDRQRTAVVRYLALNPVEASLCNDPAAWPWSSFAASIGSQSPHPCLDLDALWRLQGRDAAAAQRALLQLVS